MKASFCIGLIRYIFLLLIGPVAACAQTNVQVWMRLGKPSYTAGEFRVPLDYAWKSIDGQSKLARLKVDFSNTGGWLTGDGKDFGKIYVVTPTNTGWVVEKPLGVISNYAFEYKGQQFTGTWGPHLLVLRNDHVLNQKLSGSRWPTNDGLGFLSNPWVLAGIVAAAIAIPLAISSDEDDANGYYREDGGGVVVDPDEVWIDPVSITSIKSGPDNSTLIKWVALTGMTYKTYLQKETLSEEWTCLASNLATDPPENTWTDSVPRASPAFYRIGGTNAP